MCCYVFSLLDGRGSSSLQEVQCQRRVTCNKCDLSGLVYKWSAFISLWARKHGTLNIHGQNNVVYAMDTKSVLQVRKCCIEFKMYRLSNMDEDSSVLSSTPNPTNRKVSACLPLNFTWSANWKRISEVMISIWRHSHSLRPDGTSRVGRLVLPPGLGKPHRKQWQGPKQLLWLCGKINTDVQL